MRFAIIDTDSHHGDGTRSIFRWDKDVLHICFCSNSKMEDETKIDVDFLKLVELVRSCSIEACGGRYVIIIMGGSRGDIAEYIFPRMIRILAK